MGLIAWVTFAEIISDCSSTKQLLLGSGRCYSTQTNKEHGLKGEIWHQILFTFKDRLCAEARISYNYTTLLAFFHIVILIHWFLHFLCLKTLQRNDEILYDVQLFWMQNKLD